MSSLGAPIQKKRLSNKKTFVNIFSAVQIINLREERERLLEEIGRSKERETDLKAQIQSLTNEIALYVGQIRKLKQEQAEHGTIKGDGTVLLSKHIQTERVVDNVVCVQHYTTTRNEVPAMVATTVVRWWLLSACGAGLFAAAALLMANTVLYSTIR